MANELEERGFIAGITQESIKSPDFGIYGPVQTINTQILPPAEITFKTHISMRIYFYSDLQKSI